jgi:hypothetical protein
VADMNEIIRGRLADQRVERPFERAKRERSEPASASDHPAGGSADGGARGAPPDVASTMNELIRGGTGRGVLWTEGP